MILGDTSKPSTIPHSQNCFSCEVPEAPAFASECSVPQERQGPDALKTWKPVILKHPSPMPRPIASVLSTRKQKSPSLCVSCRCSVYNTVAFGVLPTGAFGIFWRRRNAVRYHEAVFVFCKITLPLDSSNLKYRLALTKLTQAGVSLWWFQFQAYLSQTIVILQDFDRTGVGVLNSYLQFSALGDNRREKNNNNRVVGYENILNFPLRVLCS